MTGVVLAGRPRREALTETPEVLEYKSFNGFASFSQRSTGLDLPPAGLIDQRVVGSAGSPQMSQTVMLTLTCTAPLSVNVL